MLPAVQPALLLGVGLQLAVVVAVADVASAQLTFAALGQVAQVSRPRLLMYVG